MAEHHEGAIPMTLAELQAEIAAKEQEVEALKETYTQLWTQRKRGALPREGYVDFMMTEDRLAFLLQELDRLQPQLGYAQAEDRITTRKAHHDRYCAPVAALAQKVCEDAQTFVTDCQALAQLIDEQIDPLLLLTRADGQPMFDLDSGSVTLHNMLGQLPGPPRVQDITVGQARQALTHVKGAQPFSETNVERYLSEYRVKESPPETRED